MGAPCKNSEKRDNMGVGENSGKRGVSKKFVLHGGSVDCSSQKRDESRVERSGVAREGEVRKGKEGAAPPKETLSGENLLKERGKVKIKRHQRL